MREIVNKYGIDMSDSEAYYLDYTLGIGRYKLRRGYKECGCYSALSCGCDFVIKGEDDEWVGPWGKPKSNRRLLLLR